MNVVFLLPHFPRNFYHFCTHLHELGATVLGIADEEYENLHPELRASLTEYYKVSDMHDYDQLVRAVGYFTHKYGKMDRLESHAEYWLETDAKLRTDFNIPGIKKDTIDQVKHKSLMKQKFTKAKVDVAPGRIVKSLREAENFTKKSGYPIIAKPDNGAQAFDTYKINNREELAHFFANKSRDEYFLEGFINGKIYTFDGLVDREGQVVFYTSHAFSQGIMETVNQDLDIYYYSLREIPKSLEKAGLAAIKAFKICERFFHFEFFITPEGKVVALEANVHPLGGFTMDMFNFANDIDLYREWANVIVNGTAEIIYDRKYHCCYIGRKNHKQYVHSHEEIMAKYGECIVLHEPVNDIVSAALGDYGYLVRSSEESKVIEIAKFIHEKV